MASGTNRSQKKSKRAPIEKGRWAAKGTKPLPEQASIQHILSVILIHICRKVLFIATEVKITLYSISLFFGSLVCDFLPIPKIYLSSKDNVFNMYFVKVGWAWTFILVGAFIYLTSITYGCGRIEIVKRHLSRLFIGSTFWFFWSQWFFVYVENATGTCLGKAILKEKYTCIHHGFQWHSFDISGHAFLLVYINLLLVEEAKAILGWEGIKDLLRIEEFKRYEGNADPDEVTVLSGLNHRDLNALKVNYETWTPFIRTLFCCMTIVSVVSDVMLACTVIYFHTMPQKVAGGAIAISTWYFTYRFWYKSESSPGLPGSGPFKYQHLSERNKEPINRRQSSITKQQENPEVPMFMGMPLYSGVPKRDRRRDPDDSRGGTDDRFSSDDVSDSNSRFAPQPRDFFTEPRTKSGRSWKQSN